MTKPEAAFCRLCGTAMERRVPPMEDRERAVCPRCGFIDYINPINVVGTVPIWRSPDGTPQVLLCLRNIEPRKGFWTLPAGFLEVGETSSAGAVRETWEEAGARIDLGDLFSVLDVTYSDQVHLFWLAELRDIDFDPGPETIECRLFGLDEIPWDQLSFLTVRRTLELYLADRTAGGFGVHYDHIDWARSPRL